MSELFEQAKLIALAGAAPHLEAALGKATERIEKLERALALTEGVAKEMTELAMTRGEQILALKGKIALLEATASSHRRASEPS